MATHSPTPRDRDAEEPDCHLKDSESFSSSLKTCAGNDAFKCILSSLGFNVPLSWICFGFHWLGGVSFMVRKKQSIENGRKAKARPQKYCNFLNLQYSSVPLD